MRSGRAARPGRLPGPRRSRRRTDRGSALVEVTWLSVLLMVPLLYIVLAVFTVQRSAFAVTSAARAAGRAYVLAPSQDAALERARAAAGTALQDQHLAAGRSSLTVTCAPDPRHCLVPGAVVTVRVSFPVPLPLMPSALGDQTPSLRVDASHSVPYGTFREARS